MRSLDERGDSRRSARKSLWLPFLSSTLLCSFILIFVPGRLQTVDLTSGEIHFHGNTGFQAQMSLFAPSYQHQHTNGRQFSKIEDLAEIEADVDHFDNSSSHITTAQDPVDHQNEKKPVKSIHNNPDLLLSRSNVTIEQDYSESTSIRKPFVKYRLEHGKSYNLTFGRHTVCPLGVTTNKWGRKPIKRVGLAKPLSDVLDVITYVETNLRILSLGDSVGMQFHEILEEALQPANADNSAYRTVYINAWGDHESVSVTAPLNGGGALAAFRMVGLLLEEGKGHGPPNKGPNQRTGAGGWLPEHVEHIIQHNYTTQEIGTGTIQTNRLDSFDVMIFRLPHGWLPAPSITRERLERSLLKARELFGVRTIIIQTLFFNNNVQTMKELEDMHATNRMIRELVGASWSNSSIPDLLLMEFGGWVDQLIALNARLAGMDTQSNANYTLDRLGCAKFPPSIAVACVERDVKPGSCKCIRNILSIDGMHWCMETMGGRITAGIACLMQCSLFVPERADEKAEVLAACQQRCNDSFMSLQKASTLGNATATS